MSKVAHPCRGPRAPRGDAITAVLRRPGWSCHALGDARQVADALRRDAPDVLVVDLGVAAYRKLLARRPKLPPSPPVPVATGGPSLSLAVEVLNLATVAAFLRGSQLAINIGTSVTLGPISTWRIARAMGEHVPVVGANCVPEAGRPTSGPSGYQRVPRATGRLISVATVPWTTHELRRRSATDRLPNLPRDSVAGLAGSPSWSVGR